MRRPGAGRRAITLVEILIAFLVLGLFLLPVLLHLDHATKETHRLHTEAYAIAHAKFVMDTLMFQMPWRCIHARLQPPNPPPGAPTTPQKNPAEVYDPLSTATGFRSVAAFLKSSMPLLFGEGCVKSASQGIYTCDGLIYLPAGDRKGFHFRVRLKCIDLPGVAFNAQDSTGAKRFLAKDLTNKDADGQHNLIKKLILEVRWSVKKNTDPLTDPNHRKIHLVAYKCDLER